MAPELLSQSLPSNSCPRHGLESSKTHREEGCSMSSGKRRCLNSSRKGESHGTVVTQQQCWHKLGMGNVSGLWGRRMPWDPGYAAASGCGSGRCLRALGKENHLGSWLCSSISCGSVRQAEGVVCAWPLLPPGARTSPRFLCLGPISCSQTPVNKH